MATLKCERLYEADTATMSPTEVLSLVDRFIAYYNSERLHQSLGFVTPSERHDGRHTAILEARRLGMGQARAARTAANGSSDRAVRRRSRRKGVIGPCS